MSVQILQLSLQSAGVSKAQSQELVRVLLQSMENELRDSGKFVIRGIGRIELVPHRRKNSGTFVSGKQAKQLPVRVRFEVSRELKKKIAQAYYPVSAAEVFDVNAVALPLSQ